MMTQQLTRAERHQLEHLETTIQDGMAAFHEVGQALMDIRDQRLYRDRYRTWDAYCRERWGLGKSHAYRLIGAADVVEDVSPIGEIPNEAQARALVPLDTAQRQQVWQEATAAGPTTASRVQELASKALAGLSPEAQRRAIEGEEKKVIDHSRGERSAADRTGRISQGLRLLERARKLFEGLGGSEPDQILAAISGAIAAAHRLED